MKTQGSMTINFLYDNQTGTLVVDPEIKCKGDVALEIIQRVYISLGYHIHKESVDILYSKRDEDEIVELHEELLNRLGKDIEDFE